MDAGYNYDHINADSILHCTVQDRMLVTKGEAHYRILVLPSLDALNAEVAEKLQIFAVAGLPIVFAGDVPQQADGLLDSSLNTQRVQIAMQELRVFRHVYFCADTRTAILALMKAVTPNVQFRSKVIPFIQKRIGRMDAFFLRNESVAMQHFEAEFEVEGRPELWDPWTGKVASIVNFRRKGDWIRIELDLQPLSSALIVFDPDSGAETPVAIVQPMRKIKRIKPIGAGGWKLRATGLVPTGKTAVIHRDFPQLIDWSLDSELRGLSGSGTYTTDFTVSAADAGNQLILDLGNVKDVAEVNAAGDLQVLYDPSTTTSNPACPVYSELLPLPAGPTAAANPLVEDNLTALAPVYQVIPQINFRLDHTFDEKNRAFLTYTQTPNNIRPSSLPRITRISFLPPFLPRPS